MDKNLIDYCTVNNSETDTFVGIRYYDGQVKINFPLGYELSNKNQNIRKDILNLISLLKEKETKESEIDDIHSIQKSKNITDFPFKSYLFVIKDFLSRGYYKKDISKYVSAKKGNIVWNRTMQKEKKYIDGNSIYFLNFTIKKRLSSMNELITKIHKYCVYESFKKIGWLYSEIVPSKPFIELDNVFLISTIRKYLDNTFNDTDTMLFRAMINIIKSKENISENKNWYYGTFNFEFTWEHAVDKTLGIKNKSDFFPRTQWYLEESNQIKINNALMPDTIMIMDADIYILDSKYYKFGITSDKKDLPNTSSIYKQIAYGEYVHNKYSIDTIYNVFILPYNSLNSFKKLKYIGYSKVTEDKRLNKKIYDYVYGIMLDTKHIINLAIKNDKVLNNNLKNKIKNIIIANKI